METSPAVLAAETVEDLFGYTLEGHVQSEWGLAECSPPAVAVLMAALAGEPSAVARRELLDTVAQVAVGWADFGGSQGEWPEGDACRASVEQGFWRLLELSLSGNADDADAVAEICELLDLAGDASGHYRALLRERVRAKTKRRARRRQGVGQ
ncbi:hypothetical protein AB0F71_35105 [Kitasatospora sp. NPDC028055]|uniref:hypothetical protein n=1 Tax=Kitasatospora sp. NPDC028055 TaxID=3155653 RepID=UPI0033FBF3AC